MEPVPEAERMEEFRSSPLSSTRLQNSPAMTPATAAAKAAAKAATAAAATAANTASPLPPLSTRSAAADADDSLRKPAIIRRANEPLSPVSPSWGPSPGLSYRPRTTSPLSGHMRSRSTASVGNFYAPPMGRTQSMPGVNGAGHFQFLLDPRLSSPSLHRPPAINTTARTPRKTVIEDVFPSSPTRMSVIHDLDNRRPPLERSSSPNLGCPPSPSSTTSLARTRRPQSPFRRLSNTSAPSVCPTTPGASEGAGGYATPASSVASSPSYRPYDSSSSLSGGSSYGSVLGMMSSSSVPSTPTSTRSRSPSISSLETIPDSPDAEEEALEAERIAQLKAAADAAEGEAKGRNSLDGPPRGRMLVFGPRDKRKRWSVCGAERRGDLDLETIWED